jgi:hypothetical protein
LALSPAHPPVDDTPWKTTNTPDNAANIWPTLPRWVLPPIRQVYSRTHSVSEIVATYGTYPAEALEQEAIAVRVPGRIQAINLMGKAAFIRFTDGAATLQAYLRRNELPENEWLLFKRLDLGDFIGVAGKLFRTKTGELSVHTEQLTFLTKALLPPPDKHYGLHDIELRYRRRYADLMANRDVRGGVCQARPDYSIHPALFLMPVGISKWKRPCSSPSLPGRRRGPLSPTTTRWTCRSMRALHRNCI